MTAHNYLIEASRSAGFCRKSLVTAQLQAGEEDNPLLQHVLQKRLAEARALEDKLLHLLNLTEP